MKNKVYDSEQTLMAGLKAEQETIVEYTKYLNLAKENKNEAEVKLWEHIIADEKEHVKEFENALKGDFKLLDTNEEIKENFMDDIIDVLADNDFKESDYKLSEEDPHYYIDFRDNDHAAYAAYSCLRDTFLKADVINDDGIYYVHVLRR